MRKVRYSSWWLLLIAGIILILIGVFGIIQPLNTFLYLVKYLGFALMLSSLLLFIHVFSTKTLKGEHRWLIADGLIDMVLAVLLIFNPFLSVIAFPLLIGSWLVIRGVIKILHYAFVSRLVFGSVSILIVGIISLISGILIMVLPNDQGHGLSITLSIVALLGGGLYIFDAIRYKRFEHTIIALL
jgi:uncharacterized membrane protein HdeD (DUF308 family)